MIALLSLSMCNRRGRIAMKLQAVGTPDGRVAAALFNALGIQWRIPS
jgi:hypothetical protein